MIKELKNYEGSYTFWDTKTGVCVDVTRIQEYNPFGKKRSIYRVDKGGVTIGSMMPLSEAKSKARKALKESK